MNPQDPNLGPSYNSNEVPNYQPGASQGVASPSPQPIPGGFGAGSPQMSSQSAMAATNGKDFMKVFFLAFVFGFLGVDRFYVNKVGTGILKLITGGGVGIWVLIDLILIVKGSYTDKQGNKLVDREGKVRFAKNITIIAVVLAVLYIIFYVIFILLIGFGANSLNNTAKSLNNSANKQEASTSIKLLTIDNGTISTDISSITSDQSADPSLVSLDVQNLKDDCSGLNSDYTTANNIGSFNNSSLQSSWQSYLSKVKSSVSDCNAAAGNFNSTTSSALSTDISSVNSMGATLSKEL